MHHARSTDLDRMFHGQVRLAMGEQEPNDPDDRYRLRVTHVYPGLVPTAPAVSNWHPEDRRAYRRWMFTACLLAVAAGISTGFAMVSTSPWPGTLAMTGWSLAAMALWWALDVYGPR